MIDFGFNKKAYEALPVDLRRTLDHAAAAAQVYGLTDYHAKNAIALERLRTEFKGKVEILQLPAPVLRDLKKLAAEVVKEESEKSPMARKVHASFTKFQAQLAGWARLGRRLPPVRGAVMGLEEDASLKARERRQFIVKAGGVAGDRGGRGCRRRPERHRPAEGPVADVHDVARRARHNPGRGPAAREGRRRDERRAIPDRGLPERPDHAAIRVLRRDFEGHHRGLHVRAAYWAVKEPASRGSTRSRSV